MMKKNFKINNLTGQVEFDLPVVVFKV